MAKKRRLFLKASILRGFRANRKIAAPVSVEVDNIGPDVVPAIPFDLVPIRNNLYGHGLATGTFLIQLGAKGSAASAILGNSPKTRKARKAIWAQLAIAELLPTAV